MSKVVFNDSTPGVKGTVVTAAFLNWLQKQLVPVGAVFHFAAAAVPADFLVCRGDIDYSTTTYADLFAVIGYTYGGSGGVFRLPELRGEFIRGFDGGRGVDVGRSFGTSQVQMMKAHRHEQATTTGLPGNATDGYFSEGFGNINSTDSLPGAGHILADYLHNGVVASGIDYGVGLGDSVPLTNWSGRAGGSGEAVGLDPETRPCNVALLACIKY